MTLRHLTRLSFLDKDAAHAIVAHAHARKAGRGGRPRGAPDDDAPLEGHVLGCIFEKPSTRTRVSFDLAMRQLGGSALTLSAGDLQLGRGETVEDTARVLSRYVDGVMIRALHHETIEAFAAVASVPVINGLSDEAHPVQALADVMTVEERLGRPVAGTVWAWLGDGNNVAESLIAAARIFGFELRLACPPQHRPSSLISEAFGHRVFAAESPEEAAEGADVVVTDVWFSMGDERTRSKLAAMQRYQVTPALMERAAPHALFLHCLPAHRGEEVLPEVIDGPMSAVWDEAENRLHVQKAILLWTFNRLAP
ncbi:MAG: ornithine carbamoyltransferase [Sphingomonadaceae bacterium]|nr:ornithine carbamoyltransferase [Sphingomonadaceae bacterium]